MWLMPLLLSWWVCGGDVAEACSCGPRSTACGPPEDFWRVGAVFAGRVTAIDRPAGMAHPGKRRVRIQIIEKFRGDIAGPRGEVTVFTDAIALCGFPFRIGKEYFVYARQDQGRLVTSTCSRTALLERAQVDLAYARNAVKGSPPAGRIVGEVRLTGEVRNRIKLLSGIPIVIARQGATATATTDSWGRYAIEPPAAGTYVLDVQLPDTQFTPNSSQRIEFPNDHGCTELNIDVLYDGRVTGRVTDSAGRGVAGVTVSYERWTRDGSRVDTRRVLTRDDGTYSLHRLTPGSFAVRVELPVEDRETHGSDDPAGAVQEPSLTAALAPGQRSSLPPLVLPPLCRLARLEGTVHDAAGVPATNVRVFLKGAAGSAAILGEPAVTDTLGRFVMTVVEGIHYDVFAERQLFDHRGSEFSDPVTFTALPVMSPVRLVLRRRF
jgi:Carboxypeptidase regulatory-like domain